MQALDALSRVVSKSTSLPNLSHETLVVLKPLDAPKLDVIAFDL